MKSLLKSTVAVVFLVLGSTAFSFADPLGSAPIVYGSNGASGGGGGGSGTVTSVGLSSPNNVACVVSGSPVTTSGTLVCTPTGTSGGIPYFAGATTLSSSAALTANAPVIGGGAGVAPSVGTKTGNTTTFATATGTLTSGHVAAFDASGNIVDGGAAGAGTVTSVACGNGLACSTSPITTTGTISSSITKNTQTGTTYATLATDGGKIVSLSNASAVAVSLSQANQTGFTSGFGTDFNNIGAGAVTVTATTSIFDNGLTALPIATGQDAFVWSDGTNYHSLMTLPTMAADTLLGNFSGTAGQYPVASAVLSSCSGATNALTYNTTTHAFGCNTITAGSVTGTTGNGVYFSGTNTLGDASSAVATFGGISVGGGTLPANGMYSISGGNIGFTTTSSSKWHYTSALWGSVASRASILSQAAASSTVPSLIPDNTGTTTGIGAQAAGNMSLIVVSVEKARITAEGIQYKQATAPAPTGTGTPTIATGSTDEAGEVQAGASATSVIVTWNLTHTNAPFCVVTPQTHNSSFDYVVSNTALTITQTAAAEKINYRCTFP